MARIYSTFSTVSCEQKLFALKQFISAFHTDDPIEKLNSQAESSAAANELFKNLRKAFSGQLQQITDMNQFKEQDNVMDSCIESAIRAIDVQVELGQLAKQVACHRYLNSVISERALFQKHFPTKTRIYEREGKSIRLNSIGFYWILPTMMCDENTAIQLNFDNPVVNLAAWISILENDLIGSCKDKTIDFSPMTFYRSGESGTSDSKVAKTFANRANEAKKAFECVCGIVSIENSGHYEFLAQYSSMLLDYSFVSGLRNGNSRYGWIPQFD